MNRIVTIDPYYPSDDATIFENYNVTLVDNRVYSSISYHVVQILKVNDNRYIVWNRAGKCPVENETIRVQIYQDIFNNPFDAVEKFSKIFKTKTSNEFNAPDYKQNRGYNKI